METTSSLGMKIIASTVRQLGGTLEINRIEPGTEFVIRCPLASSTRAAAESDMCCNWRCLLWVISGHMRCNSPFPLYPHSDRESGLSKK